MFLDMACCVLLHSCVVCCGWPRSKGMDLMLLSQCLMKVQYTVSTACLTLVFLASADVLDVHINTLILLFCTGAWMIACTVDHSSAVGNCSTFTRGSGPTTLVHWLLVVSLASWLLVIIMRSYCLSVPAYVLPSVWCIALCSRNTLDWTGSTC